MAAGRGDLEGPAGLLLTEDVGQVGHSQGRRHGSGPRPGEHRPTVEHFDEIGEVAHTPHGEPRDELRLTGLTGGHDGAPEAGRPRREEGRQDAPHGSDPAVEPQLAEQHRGRGDASRDQLGAREDGGDDRQVVVAARLGQAGRGEVDREEPVGPGQAGSRNGGAAPVAGLVQGGVGQPHQDGAGQTRAECGLDLDRGALHADERDRPRRRRARRGAHDSPRTWVNSARRPGSLTMPSPSMRTRVPTGSDMPCSRSQTAATARRCILLACVIASSGAP